VLTEYVADLEEQRTGWNQVCIWIAQ
jgi:hypothetical protein